MKRIIFLLMLLLPAVSCERITNNPWTEDPEESFIAGDGVFIINEGNFTWGNGTISYFSYDSIKIYDDVFYKVNGRPLGDVPNTMSIYNDYAYIVVNNSGKVEVVKKNSLESVTTITGLKSPRNIAVINSLKAYVSSLYSDSLTIIDLKTNSVSGYVNIRRTSEAIAVTGNKAFVSNWYGGDEIMVIDTETDKVIDSVKVGREPESMVIDKKYILWVLCNGGWSRENYAELVGISTQTHTIMKRHIFSSVLDSPSGLIINGGGDTLFFLEDGIRRMEIEASEIPSEPFIEEKEHMFYKLGVNPVNGDIFVTDAVDYQQRGYIYIYNNKGDSLNSYRAGIIPASMCFKVQPGGVIE
jgi:YVTN family beta-propeller protein